MKVRGVDLRRRFDEKAVFFESLAETFQSQLVGLREKFEALAKPPAIISLPSPVEIIGERVEAYKSRAEDLRWLSGCIVNEEIHDMNIEEMATLGIIGYVSDSCGHDHSSD